MAKRKVGRPSKYNAELQSKFETIVDNWLKKENQSSKELFLEFTHLCGREQIAHKLGISRDSTYEFEKKHEKFSDTIKRWESKRNDCFYRLMPYFIKNPTLWIFLSKNFLGYSDRSEIMQKVDEIKTLNVKFVK